jgi:hypothetical protein
VFAALLATALTVHPTEPARQGWQTLAATAVLALVAWRVRNLSALIAVGAVAITLLTLL